MPTRREPRRQGAVVAAAALGLSLAGLVPPAAAQAPKVPYDGAEKCMECHTQPTLQRSSSLPFVLLTEYAIWKLEDKHAQAYAVLKNDRGRRMGELLHLDVTQAEACLNCHAMNALKTGGPESFKPADGVSCGGCHGPSAKWLTEHADPGWRKLSPEQKTEKGMVNLRDPARRAGLCMSCHVGNAAEGKVVTHAMFAAGHPPLPPFEVATFSFNQPQHWRDTKDVPFFWILKEVAELPGKDPATRAQQVRKILERYQGAKGVDEDEVQRFLGLYPTAEEARKTLVFYPFADAQTEQTRLALTGAVVSLRETLRLVVDRAGGNPREDGRKIWPELLTGTDGAASEATRLPQLALQRWPEIAMAHSDCYACHHDLRYPGYRQVRGFGYRLPGGRLLTLTPGRPTVRSWPMSLLAPATSFLAKDRAAARAEQDRLAGPLEALVRACDAQAFGEPDRVARSARQVIAWCDTVLQSGGKAPPNPSDLRFHLQELTHAGDAALLDYESARIVASVLGVLFKELKPRGTGADAAGKVLAEGETALNVRPYIDRMKRRELMQGVVAKLAERSLPDAGQFWRSVEDRTDMALLQGLRSNQFLGALRNDIKNAQLNSAMQTGVVDKLEQVSNEELDSALKKLAAYNPAQFRSWMKEIAKRVPAQ